MKALKKILVSVLVLACVVSAFAIPASAATGKSKSYNVFTPKTITITTNKSGSASLTFKSTGDGSFAYGAKAPILSLKVYNHNTHKTQWLRVTGSRLFSSVSSTLKLNQKNTKYTVTVSYIYDKSINWGKYSSNLSAPIYQWYEGIWQITATSNLSYTIK